jgi:hypothetical protein|uniref:Uncharacterized protein n=1 Tax=Zea mays TaxID=4577 RepID=A0A804UL48_MAIZE
MRAWERRTGARARELSRAPELEAEREYAAACHGRESTEQRELGAPWEESWSAGRGQKEGDEAEGAAQRPGELGETSAGRTMADRNNQAARRAQLPWEIRPAASRQGRKYPKRRR